MKLRDLYRINSKKGFFLSVLFHLTILAIMMTATLQLTTPQGIVLSEEMELGELSKGAPIPIDIKNTLPKGDPDKEEVKESKEDVVEVPKPKVPEKIETQRVEEKPKEVVKAKPKTWVPVEDTDIDDSAQQKNSKTKSSDDMEQAEKEQQAKTESDEGGAGVTNSKDEEMKTDETGEGGTVHSEKELKVVNGAPYKWPFLQRVQRNEGTTVIRFTVSSDGIVEKVWVHESSGHEALDRAAVDGHYQAKYESGFEGTFQKRVIWRLTGPAVQMPFRGN